MILVIIPHTTSCGGYNVFDCPSVVSQSCFSCQHNSSKTAQQNFMTLGSYEGHNVYPSQNELLLFSCYLAVPGSIFGSS